ncbi:solute carrier family 35 member C2-like isoform X3 [Daktulosphaira vitifoliae]|nr:solute carrier family 35 member C2-like isoform X3 [Daktulosphaira vitifoliae]XP_050535354.1 solute carrier family 35 member C2-like isoform X3 [Daktulosphaira vitifoliae]XP_050535355.1 solute carrier family 35 member C2-like isoform X3 [Daktulosphaira vitifoliae]
MSTIFRYIYHKATSIQNVQISWDVNVSKFGPTGISSGIDVGLSNWGLELVNISLYTMTKSTAIIFVLINALILRLEKATVLLFLIVFSISGGLFLFTFKTTDFSTLGFILILTASFSSGFRWTLSQFIMQKSDLGLKSPVDMIYFTQPWMLLSVFPIFLFLEGDDFLTWLNTKNNDDYFKICMLIIIGSLLAFSLEVSEYYVVYKTSSLTLTVVGIIKEVCSLVLAVECNGDKMTPLKILGLALCLCGVIGHVWHKYNASRPIESRYGIINNEDNKHLTRIESEDMNDSDSTDDSTQVLFDIINRRRT